MNLFVLAWQLPAFVLTTWLFTAWMTKTFPTLTNKRILVLIAHPDDEAMFFAPALLQLTPKILSNQILILCFSSGNASGLGSTRKLELQQSAKILGISSSEHVVVIEDDKFPDSMTATWDAKLIGTILQRYVAKDIAKTPSTAEPTSLIDVIITFDPKGVSGHPNHTALHHGAVHFLKILMQRHRGWDCPVKLYSLTSTNVVRKYSSVVDSLWTILSCLWAKRQAGSFPSPLVAVSGPGDMWRAQKAMTQGHRSQMRWFRWGWVGVSRYMVVNDLRRVKV